MAKSDYTTVTLKKIGAKLKRLRQEAGYSSYESFAMENELSNRYYWGAEKGQNLSLLYLMKILQIHKITIEEFFMDLDG